MGHQRQQPTRQPQQQEYGRQPTEGQSMGQPMDQQSMGGQQMGQPTGQQMGGQGMQQIPHFEDHLTNELRIALEDFNETTHVAEWCAKECAMAGPQLADCARICEDLADLAALNEKLIARDSMFGPEVAELFIQVAIEGLPELRQHQQHHPHVIETIATIERTIESCRTVLRTVGGVQGTGQSARPQTGGQQMGGQQMGGQEMGQPMERRPVEQQPTGQQMGGQQPMRETRPPGSQQF